LDQSGNIIAPLSGRNVVSIFVSNTIQKVTGTCAAELSGLASKRFGFRF